MIGANSLMFFLIDSYVTLSAPGNFLPCNFCMQLVTSLTVNDCWHLHWNFLWPGWGISWSFSRVFKQCRLKFLSIVAIFLWHLSCVFVALFFIALMVWLWFFSIKSSNCLCNTSGSLVSLFGWPQTCLYSILKEN